MVSQERYAVVLDLLTKRTRHAHKYVFPRVPDLALLQPGEVTGRNATISRENT